MNVRSKQILQWVFIAAMLCWVLTSTARAGKWGLFWWSAGALLFALLIGLLSPLFTGKTRRLILKNMTADEKVCLSHLGQQAGKSLGLRSTPFAFLIPLLGMLFGMPSLIYTVPPAIILLVVLCLPVWRAAREQINATLLATEFARENGIKTLGRNSPSGRRV